MTRGPEDQPGGRDLTLDDLAGRVTITVEELSALLGLSRTACYQALKRGDLPSFKVGRRTFVPVPRLLALLGADQGLGGAG